MREFVNAVASNVLSLVGSTIVTASAALIVSLLAVELIAGHHNPYVGIVAYMILPGFFVFGLALIPIGIVRRRRRRRAAEKEGGVATLPVIDMARPSTRRVVLFVLVLTVVNLIVMASVTYKGVEYMDSTEFCGLLCHSVMAPEYTAYSRSPHARVKCASCHIGPGADWFVKSKLSGAWQVVSVTFDLYSRPIPTPIHNLRPARETCEQCHWPTKFVGDTLKVRTHYLDDEENTEVKTVVLLRVGGIQGRESHGIHWHVDPNIQIRYRSDETREIIDDVEMTLPDGTVTLFKLEGVADGAVEEKVVEREWRVMDCVDCHNRPTHIYRVPEQEVDQAIQEDLITRSLPFVRRESIHALRGEYATHDEAREGISEAMAAFYEENYPDVARDRKADIEAVSGILGDLYSYNVYPSMNLSWGTYPDHIGHVDFPGCFRCHDDEHATVEGDTISQDCDTCHTLLAMEEEDPEVLGILQP